MEEEQDKEIEPCESSFKRAVRRNGLWMESADWWVGWFLDVLAHKGDEIPLGLSRLIAARLCDFRRMAMYGDKETRDNTKFFDMKDRLGYMQWQIGMFERGPEKGGYYRNEEIDKEYDVDLREYLRHPWQ